MNEPPKSDPTQTTDEKERQKSRDPLVGTVLDGRFQIEEVLGSGGMSVVYKATQLRVNRHVAIKTLRLQLDSKDIYRERFQREIASLCALSHPNIVTVYDAIIGPDDQPYVVMDYLRGRSLEALIEDEGPLSVERFARISIQICSALEHAHKKGIIHRDLKPGNVVLMDDENDFVKVVDFGLAKIGDQNRRLTHSGELWGSPPYMSPEQCMGEAQDHRSDLYSIGAVMYEMLTGFDPYRTATSVFEFIRYHTSVAPPAMMETNPLVRVPSKIEAVVFKALEKEPSKRYQTAKELQDAIVEASTSSLDREKGEFLFHMANQTSTSGQRAASGHMPEPEENSMTASQAFKRALNPFNSEMLLDEPPPPDQALNPGGPQGGAPGGVQADPYAPREQSFSPSVQKWRPGGAGGTAQPPSELVQPQGEVVQPAGQVVPPQEVPRPFERQANPASSFANLRAQPPANPPANSPSNNPSSNPANLAGSRLNPGSSGSGPGRMSRPGVDSPGGSNAMMVTFLLILAAAAVVAVGIYVVPGLTGHGGSQAKTTTAPPAATVEPGEAVPADSPIGSKSSGGDSQTQPATAKGDEGKDSEQPSPKPHPRHVSHTAPRPQAASRPAHTAVSAPASRPAATPHTAPPAHSSGKTADPWSALDNMRRGSK